MTDFSKDTGEAFDRAIAHSKFLAWFSFVMAWFVVVVSASYFAAHILVWLHKGRPVVRAAYRASHGNYWVVDREAISIHTK